MNNKKWFGQWIRGDGDSAPYLRKTFSLESIPNKAIMNLCGLGWHELYINGNKADDRVLSPVVTQYDRHVSYIEYNVREHLKAGKNTITVILGNGWYNSENDDAWRFSRASWRDLPKLNCELVCDGNIILYSDESWKTYSSPIVFNCLRNGETYDARKEIPDLFEDYYDDSEWGNATQTCPPPGTLIKEVLEPCKVMQKYEPVAETKLAGNIIVYDFGTSLTGWCEIEVAGDSGAHIKIEYGEMIRDNMDLDQGYIAKFNKSGEFQTDCYYLKGKGIERWQPRFTYHGFRYTKISYWGGNIEIKSVKACFVHNSFASNGKFNSSCATLNRLQELTRQSYLSNFTGIPTDCPHREKNGWTGDAQLASETGLWNFDPSKAYEHFNRILSDTQRVSGQLPGIAPSAGWGYNTYGGPAWDICLFELPYQVYRFTGNDSMIRENYPSMRQYIEYCREMATDNLVHFGLGDWCHFDRSRIAPVELTSSAYYFYAETTLSFMARLIGNDKDYEKYSSLSSDIRQALNSKYTNSDGTYADDSWTALACVLFFKIYPKEKRQALAGRLNEKVISNSFKADFGILGAKFIPRVLADFGHADSALKIITQEEFPGWGYWVKTGATALWENWSGVDSRNHIMFGDISAWMYEYLSGITPDINNPGFKHFFIRPNFADGIDWVKAEHVCPYGKIEVEWKRCDGTIELNLKVPKSTTATLILSMQQTKTLGSGDYHFQLQLK